VSNKVDPLQLIKCFKWTKNKNKFDERHFFDQLIKNDKFVELCYLLVRLWSIYQR